MAYNWPMTADRYSPATFFELHDCLFADLFSTVRFVWEILPRIGDYLAATLHPAIMGTVLEGAYLEGPIYIGPGTVVEPGAYIKGPAWIGPDCEIRQAAYLRGNVLVGRHSVIGHATEVKNSILLDHAGAAHFNYVGDSILGNHVNLGAGTRLANLKNTPGEIVVKDGGQEIHTGLRKFGAILGDGAKTGCNAVTNPGTVLGRGAVVYPCLSVRGVFPAGAVVKPRDLYTVELKP
ncbi:MAG: glucose-1-phosphate thymidylyltransferase [Coprothermobacterota bacterium]|nr:glucose-1-phosphate thymidylyltransferase [Coprothermobacterota bacterium]